MPLIFLQELVPIFDSINETIMTKLLGFESVKEITEFIETFNNAVFRFYDYNQMDGQQYIWFRASRFAAEGIARETGCQPELRSDNNLYRMCIS